ncbi:MAG: arsenate reductase ArsC [Hyphomicrobiaceae bacterium]
MSRSILLLGTRNKSRSIMAEAYINHVSDGRWRAHSAGNSPADRVHPMALKVLTEAGIELPASLQPKSRELFADPSAPPMDVIVSLCEEVADAQLLEWPGSPRLLHWPMPDPTAAVLPASDRDEVFRAVLDLIQERADLFLAGEAERRAT